MEFDPMSITLARMITLPGGYSWLQQMGVKIEYKRGLLRECIIIIKFCQTLLDEPGPGARPVKNLTGEPLSIKMYGLAFPRRSLT